MSEKKRKKLARHGRRGSWVKVFLEKGHELVRVQWKTPGARIQTESWPNTKENVAVAKAWGEGKASSILRGDLDQPRERLTLERMWELYAEANFPHLRPRTQTLYAENFRRWALMWGWQFIAERTTLEMADEFRSAAKKLGLSTSTIRKTIYDVKMVFAWAETRELLGRNRLRMYRFKVAKEDRPKPIEEYRGDEFRRILSQLNPARPEQWRGYVALGLCGLQGARQNAVLHLRYPDDIRLGYHELTADGIVWVPGEVTWRSEWDKLGRTWKQPLRLQAQLLVEIAVEWRERAGYKGTWLLFPGSSKSSRDVYSQQSLWAILKGAERRAGIDAVVRRAGHSLRRMLAGDVAAETGDFMLGLQAIGDTDPRQAAAYIRARTDRIQDAFDQLDAASTDLPTGDARRSTFGVPTGRYYGQGNRSKQSDAGTSKAQPTRNAGQDETGDPEGSPVQLSQSQEVTE